MLKRLLLMLVLAGLVFGGIFAWKMRQMEQQAAMSARPPPAATVAVTEVREETWQPRLSAVGSVEAAQGIFVTNEVAGKVSSILFESGQKVRLGEVILQLDDSVDQADLKGLIAERNLAEIKLQRLVKLLRDRSVSQADHDEAKAQLDGAEARVSAKQALISKKRVTAPFAGLLGIRKVDLGEYLPPGAQIVPLDALEPIYVDYSLPERYLSELKVGQSVSVTVAAHPNRAFEGRISAINPGIERSTRSVRIRATFTNPEHLLRPGMFAEVQTLLPARKNLLTLPRTAISYAPYGDAVFAIVEKDGKTTVERRPITTGAVQNGRVAVEGLQSGDRVVVAGQVKLRNGQEVRIDNRVVPQEGTLPPGSKA